MKDIILKEISKIVIPFIRIFGVYIIFNGHLSPGGGFAGGTIIGVSIILYRVVNGKEKSQQKLKYKYLMKVMCGSAILYGVLKGYSFISGGSDLNFPQPPLGQKGEILSGGFLLPLNLLVGSIVAISMYCLYCLFNEGDI